MIQRILGAFAYGAVVSYAFVVPSSLRVESTLQLTPRTSSDARWVHDHRTRSGISLGSLSMVTGEDKDLNTSPRDILLGVWKNEKGDLQ